MKETSLGTVNVGQLGGGDGWGSREKRKKKSRDVHGG